VLLADGCKAAWQVDPALADNIAVADDYCGNHKVLHNHHSVTSPHCSRINSPFQIKEQILLQPKTLVLCCSR